MPDIPEIPGHLVSAPGVQMNPPPAELMDQTMGIIGNAVSRLKDGERGKLVWIASSVGEQISVNLAVVNKFNDHFEIAGWIGKTHGQPIVAGIVGHVSW